MLCDSNLCTGCLSCYNACAFGAIRLVEDAMGVLHPTVEQERCRNCGKCEALCPVLHPPKAARPLKARALYARDEENRKRSSSGGVAYTLYCRVLGEGGAVFGTGFDERGMPGLCAAQTKADLEDFRGSKYVYAHPGLVYREVEQALKQGKQCLFIGTPCQVAALRAYLKTDQENLITVDLVCHGTPPQAYLMQHLVHRTNDSAIGSLRFRGERGYQLDAYDRAQKRIFSRRANQDLYYTAFLQGLNMRKICYSCPYAGEQRVSDITIGDFWGLAKDALNGYSGRVSLALSNTERGERFLNAARELFCVQERTVEEAVAGNDQLRAPTPRNARRATFERVYCATGDFRKAARACGVGRDIRHTRIRNKLFALPRFVKHRVLKK